MGNFDLEFSMCVFDNDNDARDRMPYVASSSSMRKISFLCRHHFQLELHTYLSIVLFTLFLISVAHSSHTRIDSYMAITCWSVHRTLRISYDDDMYNANVERRRQQINWIECVCANWCVFSFIFQVHSIYMPSIAAVIFATSDRCTCAKC